MVFSLPNQFEQPDVYTHLDANDLRFLKQVYKQGLSPYTDRLEQIGFTELETVIDAGCGFGQWSFALSRSIPNVIGLDIALERIRVCQYLSEFNNISNVKVIRSDLENIPLHKSSADGIFSYSAVYYTDFSQVAKEFYRVLQPGGCVYICTNGIGKYLKDIIQAPNPTSDFDPRIYGLRTLINTLTGSNELSLQQGAKVMTPEDTKRSLKRAGFVNIKCGPEGTITINNNEPAESFYESSYLGTTNVFECIARKPTV
jgi:ubiquinone/menaquinone biosynthesis C-methylase UbiE